MERAAIKDEEQAAKGFLRNVEERKHESEGADQGM